MKEELTAADKQPKSFEEFIASIDKRIRMGLLPGVEKVIAKDGEISYKGLSLK